MGALQGTRTRFAVVVCLAVAGYFVYTAGTGWLRNQQLGDDRAAAEQHLAELEDRKAYLEGIRDYVASDAYVEQQARRQLGYIRDGEVPFVVISPPVEEDGALSGAWWERLFPR
jgi:cell division protein FtsB